MAVPSTASSGSGETGKTDASFESSLADLETIVSQLEAGEKPLDESLALYEQGVAALKRCHAILDKAEKRIKLLVKTATGEAQVQEAEVPLSSKKSAASQPSQANAPSARKIGFTPPDTTNLAENENFGKQNVDSDAPPRQNPSVSVKQKTPPTHRTPDAGGSLFGRQ
jgi:exodeoxyribonuclease VII small subunit